MKNILITGASGNLGKSVTEEFSDGAFHINITARKPTGNTEKQTAWYPDLTKEDDVANMVDGIVKEKGSLSAAIHLVGGYQPGSLVETSLADITSMINLNFNTAFNIVHSLLPYYLKAGGGKFIFIGAKAAMNPVGASNNVAYALSKQMLVPFVQMINQTYSENKICAHILLPGTLDTELNRSLMPDADFAKWTSTVQLAETVRKIVEENETGEIITF